MWKVGPFTWGEQKSDDSEECDHEFEIASPEHYPTDTQMRVVDGTLYVEEVRDAQEVCVDCGHVRLMGYVTLDAWQIPMDEYGGELPMDFNRVRDWRDREEDE